MKNKAKFITIKISVETYKSLIKEKLKTGAPITWTVDMAVSKWTNKK